MFKDSNQVNYAKQDAINFSVACVVGEKLPLISLIRSKIEKTKKK